MISFRRAADNLGQQYLEIVNARKALFDREFSNIDQYTFDPDKWRCDKKIVWGAKEPFIFAATMSSPPVDKHGRSIENVTCSCPNIPELSGE